MTKAKIVNIGLWILIAILGFLVVWQYTHPTVLVRKNDISLGKPGTEVFDSTFEKEARKKSGRTGVSVPSTFFVRGNKTVITVKNTGDTPIVPSALIGGKEVYRASKILEPGHSVSAVIPVVKKADKCVILVESTEGTKFTVTAKLQYY